MMADEKKVLRLLKTARGQMDGIIKMVEENRYCIDISQQLMATEAILNLANKEILAAMPSADRRSMSSWPPWAVF